MTWTLHQGDCLEVLPTLPSASVDLILADPPYGSTECRWDCQIPLATLWGELHRIIKPQGAIVLCCKQPFTSSLILSNPERFRYCWYWEKSTGSNFAQTGFRPLAVVEEIAVFSLSPAVYSKVPTMRYYPQREKLERPYYRKYTGTQRSEGSARSPSAFVRNPERLPEKLYANSTPRSLLYAGDDHEDGLHPTQKPTSLMRYLIRTYTMEDDTVLDFCAGSGTTGVAALDVGRNVVLIEREPTYCDIIRKRFADAVGPLFANS